jgi:hypothetical protein
MIERVIACLLVLFAGVAAVAAHAAPVSITVVDATNGHPLAGAIGHAGGVNRTADRDGAFSLELDAAGTRERARARLRARRAHAGADRRGPYDPAGAGASESGLPVGVRCRGPRCATPRSRCRARPRSTRSSST